MVTRTKGGRRSDPPRRASARSVPTAKRRLRSLDDPWTLGEFVGNLQEGVYITTADGTILDANPAFLRMVPRSLFCARDCGGRWECSWQRGSSACVKGPTGTRQDRGAC